MDGEFGDISYVVKFYARTRPQYNAIYDKLCTLDIYKLYLCCVLTQRPNTVENDDNLLCGNKNKVIASVVINKEFYEILVISTKN